MRSFISRSRGLHSPLYLYPSSLLGDKSRIMDRANALAFIQFRIWGGINLYLTLGKDGTLTEPSRPAGQGTLETQENQGVLRGYL